ncbi:hypothetical protein V0R52_08920 [Pseudomonas asiatica]|uniref:hypothetical protein n=1 Tax=Pseudomonas asiatica TaxID=2219225 RepID=UPI002E7C0727|nr:hypothetical protein [Pseudomonas asiatica]MEE1916513.1 hypothetical protein [Pseudomonas asiatica]
MSELVYEFYQGGILVEMPFVVRKYFNRLFDDMRPSGRCNGVLIEDSNINRFKLAQLQAASTDLAELKAEADRLRTMANDLEDVTRTVEREKAELIRLKSESQAYIKKSKSFDLLRQVQEKMLLSSRLEFENVSRLADEWVGKVKWVTECHRIESLLIEISELFDICESAYKECRLDYQRQELLRVHESIRQRFKLDFKVLKILAGDEWGSESFHDTSMLMSRICNNVDILPYHE